VGASRQYGDALLWTVPEFPFTVNCPWDILEEIHGTVQDGFRKLSRGGVEVGGVLFGRRTERTVQILAWRPIECEHSRGPAFLLSNNDKHALLESLQAAGRDPQLQVLEPVGWFVSHTRAGLLMTEEDLELFQRQFGEPWQVTLVYSPSRQGPTRAGFFVRDANGAVRTESCYREFVVVETRSPKTEDPGAIPASARTPAPPRQRVRQAAPRPGGLEMQPRGYRRFAFVALALVLFAVAALAVPRMFNNTVSNDPLQLKLLDAQGQLRVEWDRLSGTVQQADSATLIITDGKPVPPIELDRETIQGGSVTYARLSEDVSVKMLIQRKGQPPFQEMARYVGSPVPKVETKDLRDSRDRRSRMMTEAKQLREELQRESKRARDLERSLTRLEAQWARESR
jgi:hypothetical protein